MEFFTSDINVNPPEFQNLMGLHNNSNKNSSKLSQRVTGIPLPSSIGQSDPVFITGLGETSDRLVGATKNVYGNNGSVTCTKYCGGKNHGPWNNELPPDWFGAKCIKTSNPKYTCDMTSPGPIQCTCAPSGTGWNS